MQILWALSLTVLYGNPSDPQKIGIRPIIATELPWNPGQVFPKKVEENMVTS